MGLFKGLLLVSGLSGFLYASSSTPNDTIYRKKSAYRASNKKSTDIIHTKLNVSFNWEKSQMNGEAEITAHPFFYNTQMVYLNARGMEIKSVEAYASGNIKNAVTHKTPDNNAQHLKLNTTFVYSNDSLKIDLGREFSSDEKFVLKIKYVAKPNELKSIGSEAITDDKGLYFINPLGKEKNKMPQIWTQGETQSNSAWFPTVDSPNEKMTNEIFITVDNKLTTLSNGILSDSKKNADGTRTDHWKMDLPHSPYLLMMGIGEFKKVTDTPWKGKEISYYVEKEYEPYAKQIFGNTGEMIAFFSKALGTPYPWPKYSQIVVRDYVSGAMENTSATLHGDFMVYQNAREMIDGKRGEDVISHELFHQWFGDYVTAESWSNLPLNESFATYGEYLWNEYKYGRDAADFHSYESRMGYFASAEFGEVEMIRYHYNSQEDMFDAFSYNKGGQILHMLRKYTGDKAFFNSLKLYLEKNKFKSAEIHDLRLAFEETTGEDLNWFFNQWFLQKGFPKLQLSKSYNPQSKELSLKVSQVQNLNECPVYVLPVDVDIYVNGKVTRKRITINEKEQEFKFNVTAEPELVNFDAERQLLCKYRFPKTTREYIYQYKNAPLFGDRLDAIEHLASQLTDTAVYSLFKDIIKNDSWFELKIKAITCMDVVYSTNENEVKPLMINTAQTDKNTNVRAAAIRFLSQYYKGADIEALLDKSLGEQSYAIVCAALEGMATVNKEKALAAVEKFSAEKNTSVLESISYIYAHCGSDKNINFFHNHIEQFSGFGVLNFLEGYLTFIKNCSSVQSYELLFNDLLQLSKTENKIVSSFARKTLRESLTEMLDAKIKAGDEDFKALREKVSQAIKAMS